MPSAAFSSFFLSLLGFVGRQFCVCVCLCVCICARIGSGQAIIMAAAIVVLQGIVGGVQTGWGLCGALCLSDRPELNMLHHAQTL